MTYQQTLIEFLEARLAEDWEVARAAITPVGDTWEATGGVEVVGDTKGRRVGDWTVCFNEGSPSEEQADHIARHDPKRILADVESKRAILADIVPAMNGADEQINSEWGVGPMDPADYESVALLQLLAMPYSDHDNYRDEWRP